MKPTSAAAIATITITNATHRFHYHNHNSITVPTLTSCTVQHYKCLQGRGSMKKLRRLKLTFRYRPGCATQRRRRKQRKIERKQDSNRAGFKPHSSAFRMKIPAVPFYLFICLFIYLFIYCLSLLRRWVYGVWTVWVQQFMNVRSGYFTQ